MLPAPQEDRPCGTSGTIVRFGTGGGESQDVAAGIKRSAVVNTARCLPETVDFYIDVYRYRDFIARHLGDDPTEACGDLPPVGAPDTAVRAMHGRWRPKARSFAPRLTYRSVRTSWSST